MTYWKILGQNKKLVQKLSENLGFGIGNQEIKRLRSLNFKGNRQPIPLFIPKPILNLSHILKFIKYFYIKIKKYAHTKP